MTQIAVISDVHADVHALRDALAQVERLGIEQVVCCGDLVDYGLFPEETLVLLRERGVTCIRGNHDRWATKDGADASGWDLSPESVAFLRSLPPTWRANVDGVRVVLWHAQPRSDMSGIDAGSTTSQEFKGMLDAAEADVLLVGHTHVPFVRQLGMMRLVSNPGALLRDPADGIELPTSGTFGVLTIEHERVRFEIRKARDGSLVATAPTADDLVGPPAAAPYHMRQVGRFPRRARGRRCARSLASRARTMAASSSKIRMKNSARSTSYARVPSAIRMGFRTSSTPRIRAVDQPSA